MLTISGFLLIVFHCCFANIFYIYKIREPDTIPTQKEFDAVLIHPPGIYAENHGGAVSFTDIGSRFDGCRQVDVHPFAFEQTLSHNGLHCRGRRAVVEHVGGRGLFQFHIHLDTVSLSCTDARFVLGELIALLVVRRYDFFQFIHRVAMVFHQVAHFTPPMLVETIVFVMAQQVSEMLSSLNEFACSFHLAVLYLVLLFAIYR